MEHSESQQPVNVNVVGATDYGRLSMAGKFKRVGKVILFLVTFGFAYPNILLD